MAKVFLSHSSKDKDWYISVVSKRLIKTLGEENVILDEISFQEGRYTAQEIHDKLNVTDLFVLFISNECLDSPWVQEEIFQAKELWDNKKLEQICPILIDSDIRYDDPRIPEWMQKNYNIQYINRQTKATQIILQRMIEISYERHPRLKQRNNIFVGRNEYIQEFEERIDDFDKDRPMCIIASGIKSIGRSTLIKNCLIKSNVIKDTYSFPTITLKSDESIEDFILKLYDLGLTKEEELVGLGSKTPQDKIDMLSEIILEIQNQKEIIFIVDDGCIIDHDGTMSKWFESTIYSDKHISKITFCIISKFRYVRRNFTKQSDKIYSVGVDELKRVERQGLLNRCSEFEGINLERNDLKLIVDLLSGYPEQVFYTINMIKERGIDYLRKNTNLVVEFNNKKASILLEEIEEHKEKKEFLALLASFDYISTRYIFEIVGNIPKYHEYLYEFISKAICEYVGVAKEYIRVNETIKDYVVRSRLQVSLEHKEKLRDNLTNTLDNLKMSDYNIPEFLFSLKEALLQNQSIDERYIIPSLYLKTMNDLYNTGKNKEVTEFAYKALEKEDYMDERIIFEIRYLLCSALAKLRNNKFLDEVMKISGAEHDFLFGFYYRQIGKFDKALERFNRSLKVRPNMSKAKREKVQVFIAMQEYPQAKELAKENYYSYKDNPYHIQAYFNCIIRGEKSRDNKDILKDLLDSLEKINSDVAQEMYLRSNAQFMAFYEEDYEEAIMLINKAIEINTNIQYARLVKFEISERFGNIDDMKDIVAFLKQSEYKQRYHNNIVCSECIIKAISGDVEGAIDDFDKNIRNYTEQAKDRFRIRLNRYHKES